jgi:uncharacterized membrane protein YeaQ/YmgE (transglycosylase-associated protein family)
MSAGHAYACLVIGLVCGWFTAAMRGGAYGVAADVVFGALGALLGGIAVRASHVAPLGGVLGSSAGALIGVGLFLASLRVVRGIENR